MKQAAAYLRMIKFSHTLFALPFALAALVIIYARYKSQVHITPLKVLLLILAFTGMRSFAMAINRILDWRIDAQNPRTAAREIPAGVLSVKAVTLFAMVSLALLVVSAYFLSPIASYLALPAALIVAGYSYAKRFTWLCHFWLGAAIGMAPIAVYIALTQDIHTEAYLMSGMLLFYIAGFDILYALQDYAFDKEHGVHSIPARFGVFRAMLIARVSHVVSLAFAALLIYTTPLSFYAWGFLPLLFSLFAAEHWLVGSSHSPHYEKIPIAFFNVNAVFSFVFLLTVVVGVLF